MKWNRFTIDTTTEAVDLISAMLDEIGIEGIEIEDNVPLTEEDTKGMFIDILPEYNSIEGILSSDGRIFGKMAHIERKGEGVAKNIYGEQDMQVFESGIEYFS